MRNFLLIIFTFLLTSCSLGFAQSEPPPPPAARPVRVVGKADVFYTKYSDTSRVSVAVILLGSRETRLREDYFLIGAHFSVPGRKVKRPPAINLTFYSYTHGSDYRYKNDAKVTLLVNNKSAVSGPAHESFLNIDPRGGVTEYYTLLVSYKDFLKVIKGNVVALEFGKTRFDLRREHLDAFRDVKRAIE